MCKPSGSTASTVTRSKTPASYMSPMCLRPQISVKLPAISMSTVQKNPDQLTIEDLPTIRSQVYNYCDSCVLLCVHVRVHVGVYIE